MIGSSNIDVPYQVIISSGSRCLWDHGMNGRFKGPMALDYLHSKPLEMEHQQFLLCVQEFRQPCCWLVEADMGSCLNYVSLSCCPALALEITEANARKGKI